MAVGIRYGAAPGRSNSLAVVELDFCTLEPFRVTCETCRARLKVREASAIGEIHACPKCGSMVQILPPADWRTDAAPVATAAVLTAADVPGPDFAHVPPPSDEVADMFEAAAAAAAVPQIAAIPPNVASEIVAPLAASPPDGSPFVLWSVIGSAIILVGGLTFAMWPNGEEPIKVPAMPEAAVAVAPATPSEDTVKPSPPAPDEIIEPSGEPYAVAKPTSDEGESTAADDDSTFPDLPAEEVAPSNVSRNEIAEPASSPAAEADIAATPAVAASSEQQAAPILRFDPLDFDPSQFSLGNAASSTSNPPTAAVNDEPSGDAASDSGELSRAADQSSLDGAVADGSDVLAASPANPSIAVRLGPLTDEPIRHNVAEQLAFEVDSLEIADMPLVRFIDTLTDLSGAPITLDPVALELSGSSPRVVVTASAQNATLGELMRDALRKRRLTLVENEGHVIVALSDADRRSSPKFDFSDLTHADGPDAAGVANLIQAFVSPKSWNVSDGSGSIEVDGNKLRIEQRKAVHHEMLLFCERLRLARGLPQKTKYPSELLTIDSPYAKINARLSEKTTFTFLPWTRLAEVFRHCQESSGITILVDWHRIADLEFGPSTPLACSAIDRSWEEVLDESLEPLGMAWWAVDGATIQITSREALDEIHRIEFYQIPKPVRDQFTNGDAILETLQAELREEAGAEVTTAEQLHMQLDKPSRRLIVRGTPAVHRYLAKRIGSAASQ